MLQIENTIVSFDIIERKFVCDITKCLGECCIEGDAGAPIAKEELSILKSLVPIVWDDLTPNAQQVIKEQGVAYLDQDGEMVTSIVNGKDCVFTCYDAGGVCKCAIEKAYREGRTSFYKPISCHLYPIRVARYNDMLALNYHKWQVCKAAETLGRQSNTRIYQFLKEPLIRRFGESWYEQLCLAATEWKKSK